ncbi:GNAT family N-acetyltransferase [Mesorhizobium sp. B3-1-6]|uniref:GNAT family N-acetyltransferase n=1 Tax=unclassified Mesorhizobium TaxID=325217 RepID=UPI00112727CD|nr:MULTISPECIES: GNAT family N-acetyltransferase [unclassified Mesorhizobium]TPI43350.1 GNAT family N-acetyltransferase [Mesorhizobium sp. B3-1-6]UCI26560.1 GNAT family N-acetyltransferase [Mesorhizobium sp. B2-8-5]
MSAGRPQGWRVRAPERLTISHDVSEFHNGKHSSLDDWLRNRALVAEGLSARTYVVCDAGTKNRVVGYYAISTAMEERIALPSAKLRRGMPEQVPLLLIGRLAVDQTFQGMGLGGDLLSDALRRCLAVSDIAGVRAVVAHAIDDAAMGFYQRHGFIASLLGERIMLLPIETAQALFSNV